jgi:hypothetical protein
MQRRLHKRNEIFEVEKGAQKDHGEFCKPLPTAPRQFINEVRLEAFCGRCGLTCKTAKMSIELLSHMPLDSLKLWIGHTSRPEFKQ